MEEVFGQGGGFGGEFAEDRLVAGMEEPVAGEFSEIFAEIEAGIKSDDGDDFGGFLLVALFHDIDGEFGVFGGEMS